MYQIEFDEYVTPDGQVYNLHDFRVRALVSASDYGMPPLYRHSRRGA